jgi:pyridoxamine 5'-phosphate oxidase
MKDEPQNEFAIKGIELKDNNYGSLTFFWAELYRQIRIEGEIYKISDKESDLYFMNRPRENQISALASEQSRELQSREQLLNRISEIEDNYKNKPVPRPKF